MNETTKARKADSQKAVRSAIDSDFRRIEAVAESFQPARDFLAKALQIATEGEREHRAMGKRFTNGQAKYRQPVDVAGRYMVIRWVTDPQCSESIPPEELMTRRMDVCYCHALRRCLDSAGKYPFASQANGYSGQMPETADFDYCQQIAERS